MRVLVLFAAAASFAAADIVATYSTVPCTIGNDTACEGLKKAWGGDSCCASIRTTVGTAAPTTKYQCWPRYLVQFMPTATVGTKVINYNCTLPEPAGW